MISPATDIKPDVEPAAATGSINVTFVFASRGIGGAERSMLRLTNGGHLAGLRCRFIVMGEGNRDLMAAAAAARIPVTALGARDFRRLGQTFRRTETHVAYLFGRVRSVPWAMAARAAGVRCVVAAERSSARSIVDRIARAADRLFCDGYIANSEAGRIGLVKMGIPEARTVVCPNGVVAGSTSAAPVTRTSTEPMIACIANLTPNKGQSVLLEAVDLLRREHPGARVCLCGRDDSRGRILRDARQRGLWVNCEWRGFVPDPWDVLEEADVFVLPSLFREGAPTSILEAMAARVPVIASNVGGISDLIDHERSGLLVPPGDAERLAAAIGRMLEDGVLRRRCVEHAHRIAVSRYSVERMVLNHRRAFDHFIAAAQRS